MEKTDQDQIQALTEKAREFADLVTVEVGVANELSALVERAVAENWPVNPSTLADLRKAISLCRWNEPHQQILAQRSADNLRDALSKMSPQLSVVAA